MGGKQKDFADVTKLRILKWKDDPALFGKALNAIRSCLYRKEAGGEFDIDINETMEAGSGVIEAEAKNAGSYLELEEARNRFSLGVPGGSTALRTP